MILLYSGKVAPVQAQPTEPLFTGCDPRLGWSNSNPALKMDPVPGEPDVFTKTYSNLIPGQYTIVPAGSWQRYDNTKYDVNNSTARYRIVPINHDSNIYFIQSGSYEIRIYNPDNNPNSPAGQYRYTVRCTSKPPMGIADLVLSGDAVDTNWNTNNSNNRLTWDNDRYAIIERSFTGNKEFKVNIWNMWEGDWGYTAFDIANSSSGGVLSQGGNNNIRVKTGGIYEVVFDAKTGKYFFHSQSATFKTITKYNGATELETERVYKDNTFNPTYNPTPVHLEGKRFHGWYTDSNFTTQYVPGTVSNDFSLYGKYKNLSDTRLTFYDKNKTLTTGDVYAYTWIPGLPNSVREKIGGWPGTRMTNHGLGYHTLPVEANKIGDMLVFNNGQTGGGEVKTVDLVCDYPKNVYFHNESNWGTYSNDYHEATLFGITNLNSTNNCDATGVLNNIAQTTWDMLDYQFSLLSAGVKSVLQNHEANVSGNLLYQAIARYDYIAKKYGSDGFTNFINRTLPSSSALKLVSRKQDDFISVLFLGRIGLVSFALFGYFNNLKKRRT